MRLSEPSSHSSTSARSGTTRSAASLGVRARTSATRSAMVRSSSWPTPVTTGMREAKDGVGDDLLVERPQVFEAAAAAADDEHVERQVAAGLPKRLSMPSAAAISAAAPSPCTRTGQTHTSAAGQRRPRISSMSRTAEPVGLVTSATRRGMRGSGFLRRGSK